MMNENYARPAMPEDMEDMEDDIVAGLYRFSKGSAQRENHVSPLSCGTILYESIAAAKMLENEYNVGATVWSEPGFSQPKRDGMSTERWNRLHPEAEPGRVSWPKNSPMRPTR